MRNGWVLSATVLVALQAGMALAAQASPLPQSEPERVLEEGIGEPTPEDEAAEDLERLGNEATRAKAARRLGRIRSVLPHTNPKAGSQDPDIQRLRDAVKYYAKANGRTTDIDKLIEEVESVEKSTSGALFSGSQLREYFEQVFGEGSGDFFWAVQRLRGIKEAETPASAPTGNVGVTGARPQTVGTTRVPIGERRVKDGWEAFYFGGQGGTAWTSASQACNGFPAVLGPGFAGRCAADKSGAQGALFAGFAFKNFAIEGGWESLGKVTLSAQATRGPLQFLSDGFFNPSGIFLRGVGFVPFRDAWQLGLSLGVLRWTGPSGSDERLIVPGDIVEESFRQDNSGLAPTLGVELQYRARRWFTIGAAVNVTKLKDDSTPETPVDERVTRASIYVHFNVGYAPLLKKRD